GGLRVYPRAADPFPGIGREISIDGVVREAFDDDLRSVSIDDVRFKRAVEAKLPLATPIAIAELTSGAIRYAATRVETVGIVRAARREGDHMLIEIVDGGRWLPVRIRDEAQSLTQESLIDTRVRVRGVVQPDVASP